MFRIKVIDSNISKIKDYSMFPIRIALGVVFLAHGSQKLFGLFGGGGIAGTIRYMDMMGYSYATFWGILLSSAEFFGGMLVFIGLFTRLAAFFIAVVMAVAVFTVHLKHGLFVSNQGFEFAGSLLCMAIALIIYGGGKLSADNLFQKNRNKNPTPEGLEL